MRWYSPGRAGAGLLAGLLAALAAPARTAAPRATLTELGRLAAYPDLRPQDINDYGTIVGTAYSSTRWSSHGFLWTRGSTRDLGILPGFRSTVVAAMNARGQVVGAARTRRKSHPFLWQLNRMTDLGTLGGASAEALGINDLGQVVGWSLTGETDAFAQPVRHAVLWQDGNLYDLEAQYPGLIEAWAINNRGDILGVVKADGERAAVLCRDGRMETITSTSGDEMRPASLNQQGQAAGTSGSDDSGSGFFWNGAERQWLPGRDASRALDVNDWSEVVGADIDIAHGCGDQFEDYAPILWRNGQAVKLRDLVPAGSRWHLDAVTALNNRGELAGYGTLRGQYRAFRLTLPEHPGRARRVSE